MTVDAIDALERSVETLDKIVRGNGTPGLVARVLLLEDAQKRWERIAWLLLSSAVLSLGAAIVNHWK